MDGAKVIVCRECGREFTFSLAEQEFYAQKGFTEPARCPDCRKRRRPRTERIQCAQCSVELGPAEPTYCRQCLQNTKLELEFELSQMRKHCDELEKRLDPTQVQQKEAELNGLKKELEEVRTTNDELQTRLEAGQAREVSLTESLRQREQRIDELTTELDAAQKQSGELTLRLQVAQVSLENANLAAENERLRALQKTVTALEARVSELERQWGSQETAARTSACVGDSSLASKLRRWLHLGH